MVLVMAIALCYTMANAQASHTDDKFMLSGKITGLTTGEIVLTYNDANYKLIKDTAQISNGLFHFSGSIDQPTRASLVGDVKTLKLDDPDRSLIWLEPGNMKIALTEGHFEDAKISGSQTQLEMQELTRLQKPLTDSLHLLKEREALSIGNQSRDIYQRPAILENKFSLYRRQLNTIKYTFIASHPNCFACPSLMMGYKYDGITQDSALKLYQSFSGPVKNSRPGLELLTVIHAHALNKVGDTATDFERNDINNKTIDLASFRGKSFVLLDFWRSTCIPCREFSPRLKRLYALYHSKGLDIIEITGDWDDNRWRTAVAQDGTGIWNNIKMASDNGNENLGENYSIDVIPTVILIDKNGIILGRYMGMEKSTESDLNTKLEEIFR